MFLWRDFHSDPYLLELLHIEHLKDGKNVLNYLLVFKLVPFQSSEWFVFSSLFHSFNPIQIKSGNGEANGINHSNDNLISSTEISTIHCDELAGGTGSQTNHHSNGNGSLITMTMKNNHLIVETEERSVSWFYVLHGNWLAFALSSINVHSVFLLFFLWIICE